MELVKTISGNKLIKLFLIVIFGSILLTISSKIKIPFYPVPMTMQTFVVLFLGISFGYKVGVATHSTLQCCRYKFYIPRKGVERLMYS